MIDQFSDNNGNDPTRSRDLSCEFAKGVGQGLTIGGALAGFGLGCANEIGPVKTFISAGVGTLAGATLGGIAGGNEIARAMPANGQPVTIPEQPRPVARRLGFAFGLAVPVIVAVGVHFTSGHEPVASPTSVSNSCKSAENLPSGISCTR